MKENRGNRKRGENAPSAKLTDAQAADILLRALAGETNRALAAEFGVTETTIGGLVRGRSWRGLDAVRRTHKIHTGQHNPHAKLDADRVRDIRKGYADGKTYGELAEFHRVNITTIRNVVKGITWIHVT